MERLKRLKWKGNVRELKNMVEKWLIFGEVVMDDGLAVEEDLLTVSIEPKKNYKSYMEEYERKLLEFYMKKHKGNKLAVAKELDMNYKTLLSKLSKFKI
jgi:DNA-binding NtrC family response regulator